MFRNFILIICKSPNCTPTIRALIAARLPCIVVLEAWGFLLCFIMRANIQRQATLHLKGAIMQKGQFPIHYCCINKQQKAILRTGGRAVFRSIKCVFLFHVTLDWPFGAWRKHADLIMGLICICPRVFRLLFCSLLYPVMKWVEGLGNK